MTAFEYQETYPFAGPPPKGLTPGMRPRVMGLNFADGPDGKLVASRIVTPDTRQPCGGVYAICRQKTGRLYIGSTNNFHERWKGHLYDLRAGVHVNRALQEDWDADGGADFSFLVVRRIDWREGRAALRAEEQATVTRAGAMTNPYNEMPAVALGRRR